MKTQDASEWLARHGELTTKDAAPDLSADLTEQDYVNKIVDGKRVDTRKYDRWFSRTVNSSPFSQTVQTVYRTANDKYVLYERTIVHRPLTVMRTIKMLITGELKEHENKVGSTPVFRCSVVISLFSYGLGVLLIFPVLLGVLASALSVVAITVERAGRSAETINDKTVQCFDSQAGLQERLNQDEPNGLPSELQPELYQ